MAKKFNAELQENKKYKLKKFFYALRSATACLWILEKEKMPPIEYPTMLEGLEISNALVNRIYELIQLKSRLSESYLHEGELPLLDFIDNCILLAESKKNLLPSSIQKSAELDAFFLKTLSRYDHS